MLKSFKTEIDPTEEQKIKIHKTIGTCRYIYNFYLFHNKERYDAGERFMSGKSFSVWPVSYTHLKDFAELLGVSVKTLQRWDREGILKANRTPTDRRY